MDIESHLVSFFIDILRTTAWLFILMVIFVPLERLSSLHPQKIFRKAFAADLSYYFLNSIVPKLLLTVPMAAIAWAMRRVIPDELHLWVEDLPTWARLSLALVVGEVGFYWGHRWSHQIPFLWRFHSIHHGAEEMDWLVNTHVHPLDIVFTRLCGFVPMFALGLASPMAGQSIDMVPLMVMLIGTMWGFFIHANLRWRFGWFGFLISTPAFHHWHHTKHDHIDRNYASMLPILDKVFGTWYLPKQWPAEYGVGAPVGDTMADQLLHPFESQEEKASTATV